jgi:hypothetical protein
MSVWDIDEATQLQYRTDPKALTNFYNGVDAGKPRETIDKI